MMTKIFSVAALAAITTTATAQIPANGFWYAQSDHIFQGQTVTTVTQRYCAIALDTDETPIKICQVVASTIGGNDVEDRFFEVARPCDSGPYTIRPPYIDTVLKWQWECGGRSVTEKTFEELMNSTRGMPQEVRDMMKTM